MSVIFPNFWLCSMQCSRVWNILRLSILLTSVWLLRIRAESVTGQETLNPIWTNQSWSVMIQGEGGLILALPPLFLFWVIWEIGAQHDYFDDISEDFFEVYKISVAQNLAFLETIMRFCWKCQKIRTRL